MAFHKVTFRIRIINPFLVARSTGAPKLHLWTHPDFDLSNNRICVMLFLVRFYGPMAL